MRGIARGSILKMSGTTITSVRRRTLAHVSKTTGDQPRTYKFSPDVGRWRLALRELIRNLASGCDPIAAIDEEIAAVSGAGRELSHEAAQYLFVISLLQDVCRTGGRVDLVDSELYLSWPDWHGSEGREATEAALARSREYREISDKELGRIEKMFLGDLTPQQLSDFAARASFDLVGAEEVHPSGVKYAEAFSAALQLWNMPYRGRTGRTRRFLIVGKLPDFTPDPVVVGLIEVGDDTPFNTDRDALLGIRPVDFLEWSAKNGMDSIETVHQRFKDLRRALLEVPCISPRVTAGEILARESELLERATGRSQVDTDMLIKKRIAYTLRLSHGESATQRILAGEMLLPQDRSLREGLRAIKDLSVPRVALEVTICGAIPPMSSMLGGKLVVSFLAHPKILDITKHSSGTITSQMFDQSELDKLMPSCGVLGATTKGLYPGHSALYNRSSVPGLRGPIPLRKIGDTRGTSTSLLTPRTARLAQRVLDTSSSSRQVSLRYGSGGAKRQRRIEAAVLSTGLPEAIVHSGIRRPIYGIRFVDNVGSVVWALEQPNWIVPRSEPSTEFEALASTTWRSRWLETATKRLANASEPSVIGTTAALRKLTPDVAC